MSLKIVRFKRIEWFLKCEVNKVKGFAYESSKIILTKSHMLVDYTPLLQN